MYDDLLLEYDTRAPDFTLYTYKNRGKGGGFYLSSGRKNFCDLCIKRIFRACNSLVDRIADSFQSAVSFFSFFHSIFLIPVCNHIYNNAPPGKYAGNSGISFYSIVLSPCYRHIGENSAQSSFFISPRIFPLNTGRIEISENLSLILHRVN